MDIWQELGCEPTRDPREIKRAYAALLRQVRPEDDPERFQRLRSAYELAIEWTRDEEPPLPPLQAPRLPQVEPDTGVPPGLAKELCEGLLAQPRERRVGWLGQQLHREDRVALEFQGDLQREMLGLLLKEFDRYHGLAATCETYFNWSEPWRDLGDAEAWLTELRSRVWARAWREKLAAKRERESRRQSRALDLLGAPVDERRFRRFAWWENNREAMSQLLHTLESLKSQVLRFETRPEAVSWWMRYLLERPLSVESLIKLIGLCLGLAPLFTLAIQQWARESAGPRILHHPLPAAVLALLLAALPLLVAQGSAIWRRQSLRPGSLATRLQSWQQEPGPRNLWSIAMVSLSTLTVGAGFSPWLGLFAVPAFLLLSPRMPRDPLAWMSLVFLVMGMMGLKSQLQ
ncbi:hypothetical protein D0B54_10005 [Solimonas sp. K1W22B-7]|uniref:J domain-containing protein n=1 Tax=Solimonas sp. K1W22B-7 TaxID=2303331 RepID=UPI000E32E582|nr:J domain-containing protein [Solimonas sp. K1W22B-7]AXQ28999.1 hypothetical protein D0B54_10005 [Solimonas sp. K1W22B-7]